MFGFFIDNLIALKKQKIPLVSYTNNLNIQSKLLIHFYTTIPETGVDGIAILEYIYKKRRSNDILLMDINQMIDNSNIPQSFYSKQMKDLTCLITQVYFNNNNTQFINLYGLKSPINKTNFEVNQKINVYEQTNKLARLKIIQKISVKNKFNTLYDIYYKNGVKYITTFELTDILLLDPQNTIKHSIIPRKTKPFNKTAHLQRMNEWCKQDKISTDGEHLDLIGHDEFLLLYDTFHGVSIYEVFIEALLNQLEQEPDKTEFNETKEMLELSKEMLMYKCRDIDGECNGIHHKLRQYSIVLRHFIYPRDNLFFSGLYNITTKPFYETKRNNKKLKQLHNFFLGDESISDLKYLTKHTEYFSELSKIYKPIKIKKEKDWNTQRCTFVYEDAHDSFEIQQQLNDQELISLFECGNPRKLDVSQKQENPQQKTECVSLTQENTQQKTDFECTQTTNSVLQNKQESECASLTHVAPVSAIQTIYFYAIEIPQKTKYKIEYLLNDLCISNTRFGNILYENFNSIRIIKDVDKSYTNAKYINFSFGDQKKQYHAYLNRTETAITNITFIESIEIC